MEDGDVLPEPEKGAIGDEEEEYSTISSPWKYFALLAIFVVLPVGAYTYYYRGGRESLERMRKVGYEKVSPA